MLLVNTSHNVTHLINLSRKSVLGKHVFFILQKWTRGNYSQHVTWRISSLRKKNLIRTVRKTTELVSQQLEAAFEYDKKSFVWAGSLLPSTWACTVTQSQLCCPVALRWLKPAGYPGFAQWKKYRTAMVKLAGELSIAHSYPWHLGENGCYDGAYTDPLTPYCSTFLTPSCESKNEHE